MLALGLQGFVLGGVLLYSAKKIKSNRWIGLFILCISWEVITPFIQQTSYTHSFAQINYILLPVNLALGPLLYFYNRSLIFGDDQLPRRKYLYFLPMLIELKHPLIFLLYASGLLSIPAVQQFYFKPQVQSILFFNSDYFIALSTISMAVYMVISYQLIVKTAVDSQASPVKLADLQWLKKMLMVSARLVALWIMAIVMQNVYRTDWGHYLVFIPAIFFIHWVGLKAYKRQAMPAADVNVYNKPISKSYFTTEEAIAYSFELDQLMINNRLYLDPLLKLEDVADKLNLPVKQVSNLLNQHIGKNFNDLVNSYRVDEAKRKLTDPLLSQFTIASVAFDCGFNSLATFQRCFKQFTGITPSQYQNTLRYAVAIDK